jgi:hypothetical protein
MQQLLSWDPTDQAPVPQAVLAWGAVVPRLHFRLVQLGEAQQKRLRVTANSLMLCVTGETQDLPWVQGATYAAPAPSCLPLWLPTTLQPTQPLDLILRALTQRYARGPLLLWPNPSCVIPLDKLLPLSLGVLEQIRSRE